MGVYRGVRCKGGDAKVFVDHDGRKRALGMYLNECGHSPTGFNWGYGGSGPAQLAYAMLRDALPDDADLAWELHQPFKWAVISNIATDNWALDEFDVNQWIYRQLDGVRYALPRATGLPLVIEAHKA